MRIVITNLGKTEIKDDDYNFPTENNNQKNILRNVSVQYNKIRNNISLKGFNTSRKILSIPKIRYNKYPTMSKTIKNTINLLNDKKNETFLCQYKINVYLCHPITDDYSLNLFFYIHLIIN